MSNDLALMANGTTHQRSTTASGVRPRIDLDGAWTFIEDPNARYDHDSLPTGVSAHVPSVWEELVGPTRSIVTAWYVRTFESGDVKGDRCAVLHFGAVSYRAEVWLNGAWLGAHDGAYTPFDLAADAGLRSGANRLVVRVTNPVDAITSYPTVAQRVLATDQRLVELPISELPVGKQTWYSSLSGIWQSVWLELRDSTAIQSLHVDADPLDGGVAIGWHLYDGRTNGPDAIRFTVRSLHGPMLASTMVERPAVDGHVSLKVRDHKLWDLDDPVLYRLTAEVIVDSSVVDRLERRFAFRSIDTADGRVRLNGRPLFIRGVLDQDVFERTIWRAPSRDVLEAQMRRIKAMGLNLVRCHIKVPDPAYFELADEIGLLVWAELPNWDSFSEASAMRGQQTLVDMVASLHHHPSIAIWTIINEDWGTDLRGDATQRRWLRQMYGWLKELDPTRLVVDNSPCWTAEGGNFHVVSDIADFHVYFGMPDHFDRWRDAVRAFAARPAWLWSPFGDTQPRGDEPLILSEFGLWGLPVLDGSARPAPIEPPAPVSVDGRWWHATGSGAARPEGVLERFAAQGLSRIAQDPAALARATQWHQSNGLQHQIAELRRHPDIAGFVLTELTDAFWEANGLLDLGRRDKIFGHRLPDILGADAVFIDLARWDAWGGSRLDGCLRVATEDAVGAAQSWTAILTVSVEGHRRRTERVEMVIAQGQRSGEAMISIDVPHVDSASVADLSVRVLDPSGAKRARQRYGFVIIPAAVRLASDAPHVRLDPSVLASGLGRSVVARGHRIVDHANLLVTDDLEMAADFAAGGGRALVVVDADDEGRPWVTRPADVSRLAPMTARLERPMSVQSCYGAHDPMTGAALTLEGDWVSTFTWLDPAAFADLPLRELLDAPYRDVLPRLVLLGADEKAFATEVLAGSFVGWVAQPGAYVWRFPQGAGMLTVTTLRPIGDGPVASLLLDALIDLASRPAEAAS